MKNDHGTIGTRGYVGLDAVVLLLSLQGRHHLGETTKCIHSE